MDHPNQQTTLYQVAVLFYYGTLVGLAFYLSAKGCSIPDITGLIAVLAFPLKS